jgi:hypothetical protein
MSKGTVPGVGVTPATATLFGLKTLSRGCGLAARSEGPGSVDRGTIIVIEHLRGCR